MSDINFILKEYENNLQEKRLLETQKRNALKQQTITNDDMKSSLQTEIDSFHAEIEKLNAKITQRTKVK